MDSDIPVIQPMTEKYIASFHALLDSICRERQYLIFLQAPPLKQVKQFFGNILRRGDVQLVAVVHGRVVGWCDIISQEWPGFEGVGRLGMGVAKKFRGRGLGTRLAAQAMEAAFARGFRRIELEVYVSNEPAIRLYEKLGFVIEGRKIRARYLDGEYSDILQMACFPKLAE
jgi:ribosomal protein S18 acetylase RimI-like enzyme